MVPFWEEMAALDESSWSLGLVSLMIGFLVNFGWTLESITLLLGSAFLIAAVYYRWLRQHYKLQEIE